MENNIIAYEVLDEYRVLIQDRKGEIREYQIFHETDEGILCNDFETYIEKRSLPHGLCNRKQTK